MKKIVVTLMLTLLATSFVACQKLTPDELDPNLNTGNTSNSDNVSDGMPGDGIDDVTGDSASIVEVGVAETVLLDTAEYKITLDDTAAKYSKDDKYNNAITFSTTAENFTNQKVAFCFTNVKINGKDMQDTEVSALREIYGTEVDANSHSYPGIFIPYQSLYVADVTTVETISFVIEVYPVIGSYGELGELLYSSDEVTIETIVGYEGADFEDDDEEDYKDEDKDDGYTYTEVTVEEKVLVDDELLKICTTGDITYEEGYAQKIGLTFENKTGGDLMITSRYIAVNGYNQTTYLMFSIPAGETLNTSIDLFYYDLMMSNIDTIATIEFAFDAGMIDAVTYGPITIETSAAGYEQPFDFDGTTIYNENGVEVIALDETSDIYSFNGPVFIFINNTGGDIRTNFENVTINGISVSNEGHSRLPSGMYSVRLMDYSHDMYDNDIDTIDEFACTLTIYGENFEKLADAEPITITY
ncbi:MAG: hypothetical protein IJ397_02865 [Lachnospiraceae bacterium]|nr:hypothetical protein [Lachnospiraceae bacterium]